jgi:hypothetical protein
MHIDAGFSVPLQVDSESGELSKHPVWHNNHHHAQLNLGFFPFESKPDFYQFKLNPNLFPFEWDPDLYQFKLNTGSAFSKTSLNRPCSTSGPSLR